MLDFPDRRRHRRGHGRREGASRQVLTCLSGGAEIKAARNGIGRGGVARRRRRGHRSSDLSWLSSRAGGSLRRWAGGILERSETGVPRRAWRRRLGINVGTAACSALAWSGGRRWSRIGRISSPLGNPWLNSLWLNSLWLRNSVGCQTCKWRKLLALTTSR